jgi:hypothetical protein
LAGTETATVAVTATVAAAASAAVAEAVAEAVTGTEAVAVTVAATASVTVAASATGSARLVRCADVAFRGGGCEIGVVDSWQRATVLAGVKTVWNDRLAS